jgi:hypothetical protein
MALKRPYNPMTIADAGELGLCAAKLVCRDCGHYARATFEQLALPSTTPIPGIARQRRFVCSACGGRAIVSLPDWSDFMANGMGGMSATR